MSENSVYFTSCRTPSATAEAHKLGLLSGPLSTGRDIVSLRSLEPEQAEHHHQVHDLALVREGGNIPPLWTRAQGARTRLIGLVWLEEGQFIAARPGFPLTNAAQLAEARVAVPALRLREPQLQRPVSLAGLTGVLGSADLSLDDVELVDIAVEPVPLEVFWRDAPRETSPFPELDALTEGLADVAYGVGPAAREYARAQGLSIALEIDSITQPEQRVNLGTPRALTVDQETLDSSLDDIVDYLARLLEAADASEATVSARVGTGTLGSSLRPRLDPAVVALYRAQHDFLLSQGFIEGPVDFDEWIDPEPLRLALARRAARAVQPV